MLWFITLDFDFGSDDCKKDKYLLLLTSLYNTEHAFGMPNVRCSNSNCNSEVFPFLFIKILQHVNSPKTVFKTQVKEEKTILYLMGYVNLSVTNDVTAF